MTLDEFEKLVNKHDLTYQYSDDHSVWLRGIASEDAIKKVAKLYPIEDVKRIWNAKVDRCLIEDARAPFYWKE